jgi:hypothetical protein
MCHCEWLCENLVSHFIFYMKSDTTGGACLHWPATYEYMCTPERQAELALYGHFLHNVPPQPRP